MFSVMDISHISLSTHVCKDTVIREKFVLKILFKIFGLKNVFVGMADHESKHAKIFEHQNQTQKTGDVCLCMVVYMCRESEINQP